MPKHEVRRLRSMAWSTVSADNCPAVATLLIGVHRFLSLCRRGLSKGRFQCCVASCRLTERLQSKHYRWCNLSVVRQQSSRWLWKIRLETGRSSARLTFFNSGTRSAVFSESGTVADVNDELTMLVITGSKIGRHCFKIVDGIGSSAQHFSFLDLINIDTWFIVTGWKITIYNWGAHCFQSQ